MTIRYYYLYAGTYGGDKTFEASSKSLDEIHEKQEDLESRGYETFIDWEEHDECSQDV